MKDWFKRNPKLVGLLTALAVAAAGYYGLPAPLVHAFLAALGME